MRKEGAANKSMVVLLGLIIVAVVVTVVMLQRGKVEAPVEPAAPPVPAPAALTPIVEQPAPAPEPVEPPAAAVEEPPAPATEAPVEVAEEEAPKEPLNARTLAGTKWQPDMPIDPNKGMMQRMKLEIEFAPDGTWRINDNVRAKWTVEGKRVKIYDDKGEVHYLDIEGDKLMFEGKEVQRLK